MVNNCNLQVHILKTSVTENYPFKTRKNLTPKYHALS